MLWLERYQPKRLQDLTYNRKVRELLEVVAQSDDFPHLLLHGPNGAGKRTRIRCLLHALFGDKVYHMKGEVREFKKPSGGTVECLVLSSPYHIEVTPADAGTQDKLVIQQLIKEAASSHAMDLGRKRGKEKAAAFKIIVLHQADRLSADAQASLRRTMEKYMSNCRLLLDAECITKVSAPLRSRVMKMRVAAPSMDNILDGLAYIVKKERLPLRDNTLEQIAAGSQRNMRRAVMILQSSWNSVQGRQTAPGRLAAPPYELHVRQIVHDILAEQSVSCVAKVRVKLYEAVVKLIPASTILRLFVRFLRPLVGQQLLLRLLPVLAILDGRCHSTVKDLYHLEAGAAFLMTLVARYA